MSAMDQRLPSVPLRRFREGLGLSIGDLQERIAVHMDGKKPHGDTIRNVELGHKVGSPALMAAWAKALGLHPLDVHQPKAARRPMADAS